jgi:hypothetical protein
MKYKTKDGPWKTAVVDTEAPQDPDQAAGVPDPLGPYEGQTICECYSTRDAHKIADALNAADEARSKEEIDEAIKRAKDRAYSTEMQGGDSSDYRAIITVLEWVTGRELTSVPYWVKPVLGIEQEEKP